MARGAAGEEAVISIGQAAASPLQVWIQVQAPAGHLAITPEGYSRRKSGIAFGLDCKSMAKL